MYFPLPLSLTTCPLLPQKVTRAAEMKIHPWDRTLMNHVPKWEGWLSCKRSTFIFSSSGCEWRAGTPTLGLLSHTRATEHLEGDPGPRVQALAPAGSVQTIGPHFWQVLG